MKFEKLNNFGKELNFLVILQFGSYYQGAKTGAATVVNVPLLKVLRWEAYLVGFSSPDKSTS
jgi:hypothetical protein